MSNQNNFEVSTQEEAATSLAQYLPNGKAFDAKNVDGSYIRNLINGLVGEIINGEQYISDIATNYNINTTVDFISEWESALGIPDQCFPGMGTIEERRTDVIVKLARMDISTNEQFVEMAALYGYPIIIHTASSLSLFPMQFPYQFFSNEYFTIIVDFLTVYNPSIFPVPFPWPFTGPETNIVQCIILNTVAANVAVIFRYFGPKP